MLKQWTSVREPGAFEHPFHHADGDLKIEFRWDTENDEPVLLLDGINYEDLPFLSPDFKLNEQELSMFKADLKLNDKEVSAASNPVEWEPHQLAHQVFSSLHGEEVYSIMLEEYTPETTTTNELLDFLATLKMPSSGLGKILFINWRDGMKEPLDLAVTERLV